MKPTRKSINDKHGERSLYVVERQMRNGQWYLYHGGCFTCSNYRKAVRFKEQTYQYCRHESNWWTRKRIRVVLYVRVEEKVDE